MPQQMNSYSQCHFKNSADKLQGDQLAFCTSVSLSA